MLWLTRNPAKDFYPERPLGARDPSSYPTGTGGIYPDRVGIACSFLALFFLIGIMMLWQTPAISAHIVGARYIVPAPRLCVVYVGAGFRPPAGTSVGNAAQAGTSDQPDTSLSEAKSLLNSGKISEADRAVREYLEKHANSGDGHFLRGYILFREIQAQAGTNENAQHENYQEPGLAAPDSASREAAARASLAEFTEGAKYHDPSAFDLKIVALDYVLLGDYLDADRWLTRSLQWNPHDVDGWYYLGRTKYNENRFEEAISAFLECLKLAPSNIKAEDNLGLSYAGLGRTDEASAAYQAAIAWQSAAAVKNPGPYLNLGILLLEQNRPKEAAPYLVQAVSIAPTESRHHEQLGKAYSQLNELQKAQAELETAVLLSPQNPRLHYMLGQIYRKQGLLDKAKSEFDRTESLKAAQSAPLSPRP